jgi:SAM-dependent methyltransferase
VTPEGAAVIGAGRPHDTETPDVETASERYAQRFAGPVGEWLLSQQDAALTRVLAPAGNAPLRVLDVGGGHGQVAPLLLQAGHDVTVHGSREECFSRLSNMRAAYPDRLHTVASPLWRLPFADHSFDLVVAVRLLGHTTRWRELLAEMTRVSAGFVLVEFARAGVFTIPKAAEAIFVLKRRIEGTTRPFFSYNERRIKAELAHHFFYPVASTAMFSLPMVLHRMVGDVRLSARAESALRRVGVGDRFRSPTMLLVGRDRAKR